MHKNSFQHENDNRQARLTEESIKESHKFAKEMKRKESDWAFMHMKLNKL